MLFKVTYVALVAAILNMYIFLDGAIVVALPWQINKLNKVNCVPSIPLTMLFLFI